MTDPMKQHGLYSWNELMTTDVDGAKTFYGELFGWAFTEGKNEAMKYTMANINDEECAGLMGIPDEQSGMPPSWGAYVTVDDVDKSAEQVFQLGGKVLKAPEDIPEVGRFCVIQDPQGAVLMLITYTC